MDKQWLIKELKNFKKSIQDFHSKRWNYTANIPIDVVENEIKNNFKYQKHDLENNTKLKNAIYFTESDRISKKRKKEVYEIDKSNLKQQYWRLQQYILLFSNHPAIDKFPCYDWYFLNDLYQWEEKNFSSVISDIDIMIGKIDSLSEKDYQKITKWNNKNWWRKLNPIWWCYLFLEILWKYKFLSLIGTFIVFVTWIIFTKSTEPMIDFLTKPVQNYLSWVVQNYFNK